MLRCLKNKYKYDIDVDPNRTIKYVEFNYCKCDKSDKCGRKKIRIWLVADGEQTDVKYLSQCPCRWDLNKKVTDLKLVSTKKLKPDCMNINVVYAEEGWTKLEPGESYPLPPEPPEVSTITFEAKTDPGPTSTLELFAYGVPFILKVIGETPESVVWALGAPYAISFLTMTNTGDSPIYIRNLTTE